MDLIGALNGQFPVITGTQIIFFIILILLLGILLGVMIFKKRLKGWQAVCLLAAFSYLYLVLLSTVYSREMLQQRHCELIPFWSYVYAWKHKSVSMAEEIILNIFLLVPAAALVLATVDKKKYLKYILGGGALISAFIEIQQLVLQRGWFEWDDIIHNTLGVGICCMVWMWLSNITKMREKNTKDYHN